MKPSFAVFLALVILAVSAVSALPAPYAFADPSADPAEGDGSAEPNPCHRPVPLILAPVCGSDGKVYSNRYVVDAKNACEGLSIRIVDASNCPEMKDILRPLPIIEEPIIRRLSRNAEPEPQVVEEDGSDADAAEDGQDEEAAAEDNVLDDPAEEDADADADAAADDDGDEDNNAEDADADADV